MAGPTVYVGSKRRFDGWPATSGYSNQRTSRDRPDCSQYQIRKRPYRNGSQALICMTAGLFNAPAEKHGRSKDFPQNDGSIRKSRQDFPRRLVRCVCTWRCAASICNRTRCLFCLDALPQLSGGVRCQCVGPTIPIT